MRVIGGVAPRPGTDSRCGLRAVPDEGLGGVPRAPWRSRRGGRGSRGPCWPVPISRLLGGAEPTRVRGERPIGRQAPLDHADATGGTAGGVDSAVFARLGELGPGDAESSRSRASSGCTARRVGGGFDQVGRSYADNVIVRPCAVRDNALRICGILSSGCVKVPAVCFAFHRPVPYTPSSVHYDHCASTVSQPSLSSKRWVAAA